MDIDRTCIPKVIRRKVDLPQPEGPTMAVTLLGSMFMVTSRMARRLPYQADTASALTGSPTYDSFSQAALVLAARRRVK
jgi:hypothetical protein